MISEVLINCVSVISCFYMQHTLGCLALLAGLQAVFDSTKYTMDLTQSISTFFRIGCVYLGGNIFFLTLTLTITMLTLLLTEAVDTNSSHRP